jgi:thiol peroxidase
MIERTIAIAAVALAAAGGCNKDRAPAEEAPPERTDLIGRGGSPLTLVGATPEVGDKAPPLELIGTDMKPISSAAYAGKLVVLSVVPSIDTRVCEVQTHAIDGARTKVPEGTALLTVSRDLPFAQRRFHEDAVMSTAIASDYKGGGFGRAWGLEVKENGLLARSVWVIGADGVIKYRELVVDQASEPDYDKLLAAVDAAR